MRLAIAAACAAFLAAAPAAAQPRLTSGTFDVKTTGDLVRLCSTPTSDPQYFEALGWCHGYGRGALDYHRASTPAGASPLFCPPPTPPAWADTLRRFLAWANGGAGRMNTPAVEGVFRFLVDTYPCPRR